MADVTAKLAECLHKLLLRDERNTCSHEETHRGGVIWEICNSCGARWADDEGGKPEWNDPPEWDAAREALAAYEAAQAEPVAWRTFDGEGGYEYRTYVDNENYAADWAQRNPRHVGWVEPLYAAPVAQAEQWRDIETAPKDGSAILVNAGGFSYAVAWSDEFDWWGVDDNKLGPFRLRGQAPSHWMPLPQPPKEQP